MNPNPNQPQGNPDEPYYPPPQPAPPPGSGYQGYPPPPPPPGSGYPGYPGYPAYPAQGAYAIPPGGAYAPTQPPQPAGLRGLMQKWMNVTTRPGVTSFVNELPTANWRDVWIPLLGLAVLSAITGAITAAYTPDFIDVPTATGTTQRVPLPASARAGSLIGVPLGFFIAAGILFLIAKMFSGRGTFLQQAYAMSLYWIPLQGISAIAGLIPVLGGIVGFLIGIYMIVEAVFAIAASHQLTLGKATAVVLLPALIAVVLFCVFLAIIAAALAAIFGGAR